MFLSQWFGKTQLISSFFILQQYIGLLWQNKELKPFVLHVIIFIYRCRIHIVYRHEVVWSRHILFAASLNCNKAMQFDVQIKIIVDCE